MIKIDPIIGDGWQLKDGSKILFFKKLADAMEYKEEKESYETINT